MLLFVKKSPTALEVQAAMDSRGRRTIGGWWLICIGYFLFCCTTYAVSYCNFFASDSIEIRTGKIYTVKHRRGNGSYQFGFSISCATDSDYICPQSENEATRVEGRQFDAIFSPQFIVLSVKTNDKILFHASESALKAQLLHYILSWLIFPFIPLGVLLLARFSPKNTLREPLYRDHRFDS